MIHRASANLGCRLSHSARTGRVAPFFLAVLTITIFCGILVINSYFSWEMRVQQENATDAAALAAAEVLAQEAFLYSDPSIFGLTLPQAPTPQVPNPVNPLFGTATQAALDFGAKNYVGGTPFQVLPADVAFSITDVQARLSRGLMWAAPSPPTAATAPLNLQQMRTINAVRVVGQRTHARGNGMPWPIFGRMSWDLVAVSEAVLDGNVYGFHTDPIGDINIPLVPIGLNAASWALQVESLVDPTLATPTDAGLPFGDFQVMLGAIAQDPQANDSSKIAPMMQICTTSLTDAVAQFNPANPGITPAQYGPFFQANNNQPLALDATTLQLLLPTGPQPTSADADFTALEANLTALKTAGTRLIWPLISGYNDSGPQRQAIVIGFAAARVVNVQRISYCLTTSQNGQVSKSQGTCPAGPTRRSYDVLSMTLHPTLLATSTGVVLVKDWPTGDAYRYRFPNAYVKKIRLIK